MAHPRVTAYKSAMAMQTIETAASALAEKFGVEFAPLPNAGRVVDAEFHRASQLEHIGNFLQGLAVTTKSAKEADFKAPEQGKEAEAPVVEEVQIMEEPPKKKKAKK
jgi:hypothetical protein